MRAFAHFVGELFERVIVDVLGAEVLDAEVGDLLGVRLRQVEDQDQFQEVAVITLIVRTDSDLELIWLFPLDVELGLVKNAL